MIVWDEIACKVLSASQRQLGPLLEEFSSTHILVGGTAISLQLGHRESIDFDLFCFGPQGIGKEIMKRIEKTGLKMDYEKSSRFRQSENEQSELTLFFDDVKVQLLDFSRNPFDVVLHIESNKLLCTIPSLDLLTLGAMKVYAMMYRQKIKDLVDVYFICKQGYTLAQLLHTAEKIFTKLYKVEYTLESIFDDERDMTEKVSYLINNPPSYDEIFISIRQQADQYIQSQV